MSSHQNERQTADIQKVERELTEENPEVFKGIPAEKKRAILQTLTKVTLSVEKTSGPLPHWQHLEKYNEIIPNGAERIMAMAEKQQEHRIKMEERAISSQLDQSARGQLFGLIIGCVALAAGTICGLMGHEITGSIIGGGGITGLVSVFVYGKVKQERTLRNKNKG
jgi:uncharacterized membrane protein